MFVIFGLVDAGIVMGISAALAGSFAPAAHLRDPVREAGRAVFGVDRLVVGTSGSPGSLRALRYGEGLARAHDAVLVPVIAWELPGGDRAHRIGSSGELGQACRDLASRSSGTR